MTGMVWQPSRRKIQPSGGWATLGIRRLLVQWSAVDGESFVAGSLMPVQRELMPDWGRIAREPWAQEVIFGLAGMHDEREARRSVAQLVTQSRLMHDAAAALPLNIVGWYFPVEIDPGWQPPPELPELLRELPRPLWVSVYDNANIGPNELLAWIQRWLPADVGVLFQDGVGVHARTPAVARKYLELLTSVLGEERVEVIAEAFRPAPGGGLRSATAQEFLPQVETYQKWPIFAFEGPHYLDETLIGALSVAGVGRGQ